MMNNFQINQRTAPSIGLRHVNDFSLRFINMIMRDGKKMLATKIFNNAIEKLVEKIGGSISVVEILEKILQNTMVRIDFFKRRMGSKTYHIPYTMEDERSYKRTLKMIYKSCLKVKGRLAEDKIANELHDAYNSLGASMQRKWEIYRMAWVGRMHTHLIRSFNIKNDNALYLDFSEFEAYKLRQQEEK